MRVAAAPFWVTVLVCGVLSAGCREKVQQEPPPGRDSTTVESPGEVEHPEWGALFSEVRADSGCVVVVEQPSGQIHLFNRSRAGLRYTPASTFKIFNSLVALESGVADSSTFLLRWDGVRRGGAWDADQTMAEAFRNSTVWYYRELARRVGPEAYRVAMRREHYGNATIGGAVDTFWLDNSLRVSAREQVDLLQRLQAGSLAFSERSQRIVREIMVQRDTLGAVLRWKTGWGNDEKGRNIGWIVGWVERSERRWFFAMNLQASSKEYPMKEARLRVLDGVLRSLGALPDGWR